MKRLEDEHYFYCNDVGFDFYSNRIMIATKAPLYPYHKKWYFILNGNVEGMLGVLMKEVNKLL